MNKTTMSEVSKIWEQLKASHPETARDASAEDGSPRAKERLKLADAYDNGYADGLLDGHIEGVADGRRASEDMVRSLVDAMSNVVDLLKRVPYAHDLQQHSIDEVMSVAHSALDKALDELGEKAPPLVEKEIPADVVRAWWINPDVRRVVR